MIQVSVAPWIVAPVRLPPGILEAVVGDVHGMAGHLAALLDRVEAIAPGAHLTFLGDLVDRGPDSPGALRLATQAVLSRPGRATLLPGNHEAMMLGAVLGRRDAADAFLRNGRWWFAGLERRGETMADALRRLLGNEGWGALTQGGALLAPAGTWAGAGLHRRSGNLLLVHAGIDPFAPDAEVWISSHAPLDLDEDEHPLWIREPFLMEKGPYPGGLFVAHGHTPEYLTERTDGTRASPGRHRHDGWRLGLDGGSTATGVVAAAVFETGRYRVVTAFDR